MRPREAELASRLNAGLRAFSHRTRRLPGIAATVNREALVEQLVESIRRVRYVSVVKNRNLSPLRTDPRSDLFDPVRAAAFQQGQRNSDEAFWLIFLFVHFGKSSRTGWRLLRDIYGRLGGARRWDWTSTSSHPRSFREWLSAHYDTLNGGDGMKRQFGNHRKYETLKDESRRGTGKVVESYVSWVHPPRTHEELVREAQDRADGDPRNAFDLLYHSMNDVMSFGRTARFDYLTMIGKLGLADIEAPSTYLQGATGPLKGARLLFGGSTSAALAWRDLELWLVQLEADLDLGIQGMQVLEDALCNWQKSPSRFIAFRG